MKPAKRDSTTMDPETFIPPTMRALTYTKDDNGVAFNPDYPVPNASPTQYLIQVQTAAIDSDLLQLLPCSSRNRNRNPNSSPHLPGTRTVPLIPPVHSLCGMVISTPVEDHWNQYGPRFKIGDEVIGLVRDHYNYNSLDSYANGLRGKETAAAAADYVLATEDELALKPKNITAAEAASIPLPALTAWEALFCKDYGGVDLPGSNDSNNTTSNHQKRDGYDGEDGKPLRVLVAGAIESEVGYQCLNLLRSPLLFPPRTKEREPNLTPGLNSNSESGSRSVWICATCSSQEQKDSYIRIHETRTQFPLFRLVDEFLIVPPKSSRDGIKAGTETEIGTKKDEDFDLAASFHERENGWDPVDIVIDCTRPVDGGGGGEIYRQAHSPMVVRDKGVVLSVHGGTAPYTGLLSTSTSEQEQEGKGRMTYRDVRAHTNAHAHAQLPLSASRGLRSEFVSVRPDGDALRHITKLVEEGSVRGRVARVVDLWAGTEELGMLSCGMDEDHHENRETRRGMVVFRVNW